MVSDSGVGSGTETASISSAEEKTEDLTRSSSSPSPSLVDDGLSDGKLEVLLAPSGVKVKGPAFRSISRRRSLINLLQYG